MTPTILKPANSNFGRGELTGQTSKNQLLHLTQGTRKEEKGKVVPTLRPRNRKNKKEVILL